MAKLNGKQYLVVQFNLSFSLCTVENHTLKTASIHYYNREDIMDAGIRHVTQNHHKILVDQQSTCILMPDLDFFTVLPIRNELDVHDKIPYFPSWTMSYSELKLVDVKNVVFLNGYFEPTIAILQDGQPFWQGLNQKDQGFITVMSLNIQKKQFTTLKVYKSLPSSSQFLLAIPGQTGFVYFCSSGFFIYDKQSINGFGVGVSAYSSLESMKYIDKLDLLGMNLDGCTAQFITNDSFIMALQNGHVWTVKIYPNTRQVSTRVEIQDSLPVSAFGIRVHMRKILTVSILNGIAISSPYCFLGCCGHSKLLDLKSSAAELIVLEDIADDDLYKTEPLPKTEITASDVKSGDIEILDELKSFAPMRHIATSNLDLYSDKKMMLIAATGTFDESCITFFQQALPWQVIHTFGSKLLKYFPFYYNGHVHCQYQKDNRQYLVELKQQVIKTSGNPFKLDLKFNFHSSPLFHLLVNPTSFVIYDLLLESKFTHVHEIQTGTIKLYNGYITNLYKNTLHVYLVDAGLKQMSLVLQMSDIKSVHISMTPAPTTSVDKEDGEIETVKIVHIWVLDCKDVLSILDVDGKLLNRYNCHLMGHVIKTDADSDPMDVDGVDTISSITNMCILYKKCFFLLLGDESGQITIYKSHKLQYFHKIQSNLLKLKYFKNIFYTTSSMQDSCILIANKTYFIHADARNNIYSHELAQLSHIKQIQKIEHARDLYMITDDLNTVLLIEIKDVMKRDSNLVYKQVKMNNTIDKVTWHDTSKLIVALTYDRVKTKCPPPLVHNDETDGRKVAPSTITDLTTQIEHLPGAFQVEMSKYSLKLLSLESFQVIDDVVMDDYFIILDMTSIIIETKESSTGEKQYIAVAGGLMKGEETQIKGEIHVFDIIKINRDPNKPDATHKLKHRAKTSFKGVASSITAVLGHLISTNGFKVMVYKFDGNTLNAIAFYDLHHMVSCVAAIKNYVLATDVYRSATFLAFQEDPYRFFLLGRDYKNLEIEQCDFLIDGNSLGLVELDKYGNLYISSFSPFDIQSQGGNKLLRVADYHFGAQVSKMLRIRKTSEESIGPMNRQFYNLISFYDGGISYIAPIGERVFKRLLFITARMYQTVPHTCGLNPRTYRLSTNTIARLDENPHKNVIDGDFAKEFLNLDRVMQKSLSESIGITKDRYLNDITKIEHEIGRF